MKRLTRIMKTISWVLVMALLNLCWVSSTTWAKMIETDAVLHPEAQTDRERLRDILDRKELQEQFEQYDISKAEIRTRLDSLTDAEVATLLDKIDQIPEGGYVDTGIFALFLVLAGIALVIVIAGGVIFGIVLFRSAFKSSPKNTGGETKSETAGDNQPLKTGPSK